MKKIELSQGKVALVDDDDYEWLNQWSWHAMNNRGWGWYAVRSSPRVDGKHHAILMHRQITDAQPEQTVDHKDRNGINNRQENLRLCTQSQNLANQKKRAGCSSRYKGVSWCKRDNKWRAKIKVHYKNIHLGLFDDEIEAALSYNDAAAEHFGEFARLNMIERKGD